MIESETFRIVRNVEGQHAIWMASLPIPPGWDDLGVVGSKEECLRRVQEVWPDITPRSAQVVVEP